jgi:ribose transport system substrate-binding protein
MACTARLRRVTAVALATTALLGAAVGCGSSTATTTGSDVKSLGTRTIGIEGIVLNESPLIMNMVAGVEQAAKTLGWKVVAVDPQGDPLKMEQDMTGLVNQHVSAILTFAIDAPSIASGMAAAKAAHIPVIAVGVEPDPVTSSRFSAVIAPSEQAWGHEIGSYMISKLTPGPVISEINDPPYTGYASSDVALKLASPHGFPLLQTYTYIAGNLAQTVGAATRNGVQAHPSVKYIMNPGDPTSAIIESTLRQLNKTKVTIITRFDDPQTLQLIKGGANIVTVATNDALPGLLALNELTSYFAKGTPLHSISAGFPFTVVTKSNLPAAGAVYPLSTTVAQFVSKWKKEYRIK